MDVGFSYIQDRMYVICGFHGMKPADMPVDDVWDAMEEFGIDREMIDFLELSEGEVLDLYLSTVRRRSKNGQFFLTR